MACGCNKGKVAPASSNQKKIDTSAAQKKVAQSLPIVSTKKTGQVSVPQKISKRQ
jgi:hypothetical protein